MTREPESADNSPQAPPGAAQARTPWLLAVVFLLIIGAVVSLPSVIIIVAGMVPTVVGRLFASPGDRHATVTLAALNLAGVAPVVGMAWERGHSVSTALEILSEPVPWLIMLGAAAVALALHAVIPNIAVAMMQRAAVIRVQRIQEAQRDLTAEWGSEVRAGVEARKRSEKPQAPRRASPVAAGSGENPAGNGAPGGIRSA